MDTDESKLIESIESLKVKVAHDRDFLKAAPITKQEILRERRGQRKWVFWLAILSTISSLLFLYVFLIIAAQYKLQINSGEIEVLSASILGQVVGLVYIIARAIWDDSNYKDFYSDEQE